ncbi:MAG: hypothetical protein KAJ95_11790, partial [Gammaproteobacteria bacterium]|nr:hypothetical protein [Gammaproteobacteria bacterium]
RKNTFLLTCFAIFLLAPVNFIYADKKSFTQNINPRYIIYYNSTASPLSSMLGTPYTHIILSFVTARIDENNTLRLHLPERLNPSWGVVPELQAQGKKVMISFGGGDFQAPDYFPLVGREEELAKLLAAFVDAQKLDGIDIDFEASSTFHTLRPPGTINGRDFLITLTKELRKQLPAPDYLLSHAPQPPFLSHKWHGGPYLDILKSVGKQIDWISVQYYGNPGFDNPSSTRVVGVESSPYNTSYRGLTSKKGHLHWPAHKIVVGKPVYKADAQSGHVSPQEVSQKIVEPLLKIYGKDFGGLMGWQFSTHTDDHQAWNTSVGQVLFEQGQLNP